MHVRRVAVAALLASLLGRARAAETAPLDFNRDIRPILSENCFYCHGQDPAERQALPWLDAARYADSNGFQQDGDTWQWMWRDWVVNAINADIPFDQFSIEQLAGDLLPNATTDQKIASGFNRNHLLNGEGGGSRRSSDSTISSTGWTRRARPGWA